MDRPPPVAMKKNPITGEMEKFESPALKDDLPDEEVETADMGDWGLDDDEDEDEAPAKAAPPPLNRALPQRAPIRASPSELTRPSVHAESVEVSPATAAQAPPLPARDHDKKQTSPIRSRSGRLLAVDTNAIPDFDVSQVPEPGQEVGLPASRPDPAQICRVV